MPRTFHLHESPGYQLWLVSNRWQRFIRRVLQPLDLTYVQYTILAAVLRLGQHESNVTQAMVCRHADMDPNMSSEVVRSLEAKGLLRRTPHPDDGRAATLRITCAGKELAWAAQQEIAPLIESFFAPLGEDRPELLRMLKRLNEQGKGQETLKELKP
jgi:DNA-binding MarR family transcriptional regulator